MPQQLEYFKEYIEKLNRVIGKERTSNHIAQSVYVVSCGTNDFAVNYFTVPIQRKKYSVEQYQLFLLQKFGEFLQVHLLLVCNVHMVNAHSMFKCSDHICNSPNWSRD